MKGTFIPTNIRLFIGAAGEGDGGTKSDITREGGSLSSFASDLMTSTVCSSGTIAGPVSLNTKTDGSFSPHVVNSDELEVTADSSFVALNHKAFSYFCGIITLCMAALITLKTN